MQAALLYVMLAGAVIGGDGAPVVTDVSRQLDALVEQGCTAAAVTPLGRCSDAEFLRRVWLDLAGRTPPVARVVALADGAPLDRAAVVQELLQSPEFARHWGRVWTELLTDRRPFDGNEYDARRLLQFLTESFRQNTRYDRLIAELLAGEGTSDVSGPVNFLLRYNVEPAPLAGAVSQKFLGLSLQCAECHDHPHAPWKQKDFWGLAAHFARLRKMTPVNAQGEEAFFTVVERPRGELSLPDKRAQPDENGNLPTKTVFPQLPGRPRTDAHQPRRPALVAWLTDPANPYVSRHVANTVWERLLGAKLVPNLDGWPPLTANTESALLDLLARDFVSGGFDLQRLMQVIVLSETYQRASHEEGSTAAVKPQRLELEWSLGARARIRPLSADQLHLALAQAFGYHYDENDFRLAEAAGEEFTYDLPTNTFGPTAVSLGRSLALYNSEHVRGAVEFGAESLVRLHGPTIGVEHLDRIFLALLGRRPSPDELEAFQDLGGENDVRQGLQDVIWVVLNSAEFVTNH